MVKIENLTCGYKEHIVVKNFTASFKKGEVNALIAKSGSGKSTILKAINRLHEVEESDFFIEKGDIKVELNSKLESVKDINPSRLRKEVGYIFQSPTPLPFSIKENLTFALKLHRIYDETLIEKALKSVYLWEELKHRLDQNATKLSLGQQQRLAIARVLVLNPQIILFDEPTSSLDSEATLEIEKLIKELKRDRTIILVTHDLEQVKRVCDKRIFL